MSVVESKPPEKQRLSFAGVTSLLSHYETKLDEEMIGKHLNVPRNVLQLIPLQDVIGAEFPMTFSPVANIFEWFEIFYEDAL